jgi:tetratricopeptide (TPR) repeat protein
MTLVPISCEKCGAAMAPAESICSSCGAPAPAGKAALLLLGRAEKAWESGQGGEAVANLERAIQSGLPAPQNVTSWRKLGVWLEKLANEEGRPELLPRAGQAFKSALELDDSDDIAHQLFIANASKQGLLGLASEHYQKRLQADPQDAVALKQLNVIKLSADFLAKPAPVAAKREPLNPIERWLKPRPWKVGTVSLNLLMCLGMAVVSAFHDNGMTQPPSELSAMVGGGINMDTYLFDVNVWTIQAALSALVLYLMYRNR